MADGGKLDGGARPRRALRAALIGVGLSAAVAWVPAFGSSVAGAVSTHVPSAQPSGAFLYGKAPVRPEVTRRVVATSSLGAQPLGLLYRIASGAPPTPTQVLTPDPPVPPVPAAAASSPFAPTLPALGKAWVWGCAAAIAYLRAYAAPEFSIQCPGNAGGHQATTTCITGAALCSLGVSIVIADPCPAAYMNEASNTWLLLGLWHVALDPYGSCP